MTESLRGLDGGKELSECSPQLSTRVVQDGGDGVLRVDLNHLRHRLRRLRPRLLPPRLPPRHDGRHQLQLGL